MKQLNEFKITFELAMSSIGQLLFSSIHHTTDSPVYFFWRAVGDAFSKREDSMAR